MTPADGWRTRLHRAPFSSSGRLPPRWPSLSPFTTPSGARLRTSQLPKNADADADFEVGVQDFTRLAEEWDSRDGGDADFDEDLSVGVQDFGRRVQPDLVEPSPQEPQAERVNGRNLGRFEQRHLHVQV